MKALALLLLSAWSVFGQNTHFSKAYRLKQDLCLVAEDGSLEASGQGSYSVHLHK